MKEDTFIVRTHGDRPTEFTREDVLTFLDKFGPMGIDYIDHFMNVTWSRYEDLEAACRHFGLEHRLIDITDEEILDEVAARKARGAKPTTRKLGGEVREFPSEVDEAQLDIYERRVAEAEAQIAAGTYRKKAGEGQQEKAVKVAAGGQAP